MKDFKKIYEEDHAQREKTLSELTKNTDAMLKEFRFHTHEHERELCYALDDFISTQRRLSYDVQLNAIATVQLILRHRSARSATSSSFYVEQFLSYCKDKTVNRLIENYDYAFSELKESLSEIGIKEDMHFRSRFSDTGTLN